MKPLLMSGLKKEKKSSVINKNSETFIINVSLISIS
jgi:hypothetical protein